MIMSKKEELLKEAVQNEYQCNGKYPCSERAYCQYCDGENTAHDCDYECCADDFAEGFEEGWDACMKHLATLPWDEALNEIVNCVNKNNSNNQ